MSVKAFELVPAIAREQLIGDKSSNTSIVSVECSGADFYIGASDGSIIRYRMEETNSADRPGVKATKIALKFLPQKKPICHLCCASAIERLLVLTDNSVIVLNSTSLENLSGVGGMRHIKGAASFCLNENPVSDDPFAVYICVALLKKKAIQLLSVSTDKVVPLLEKSLPDFPLRVAWDGNFICAALTAQYVMISIDLKLCRGNPQGGVSAKTQELFPYDPERTNPIVKRIAKEEFLLGGPNALGMFVTGEGISQRPPLQWSTRLISVAFSHPYVLALNDEFVTVHSILDFAQKQALPFIGGVVLGDFDGKLFIASPREIYALLPVSWEKQVQGLLEDGRVEEALELAKNSRFHSTSISAINVLNRVRLKAGFIRFRDCDFDGAKQLFHEGELDVRELISLFPLLLPSDSDFTRSVPPLHEIADVTQIARNDADKLKAFRSFIIDYLVDLRNLHARHPLAREINTALVKLYAELPEGTNNVESLLKEIGKIEATESEIDLDYIGCEQWLLFREKHHLAAMLAMSRGNHETAIRTWVRLTEGDLVDDSFPGLEFVVDQICSVPNVQLMMRYSDWALSKDQLLGVNIFTRRPIDESHTTEETFKPSVVIKRLHNRFPFALVKYLEHVIFEKKIESEEFHTHLALIYIEQILDHDKVRNASVVSALHEKLRFLLQSSNTLRLQLLLGKIRNYKGFDFEEAILFGKIGDYTSALKIFVHRLKNVEGAEAFCRELAAHSSEPEQTYRKLVTHLLHVYLDPSLEPADRDLLAAPAIHLLNHSEAFSSGGVSDIAKILETIPDNWSVTLLAPFFLRTVRSSLHHKRMAKIGCNIAITHRNNLQTDLLRLKQGNGFSLELGAQCCVCGESLLPKNEDDDPRPTMELHKYPNGVVTHAACGTRDRKTCPMTGQTFS